MDAEFIKVFIDATVEVLRTMASTELEIDEPKYKEDNQVFGVVSGLIGLAGGDKNGNLSLSFEKLSILAIVFNMLGESFQDVNPEVEDVVGELTNMICGVAKRKLDEMGVSLNMATPSVFCGENIRRSQSATNPTITIPCRTEAGKFVVEINLDGVDNNSYRRKSLKP